MKSTELYTIKLITTSDKSLLSYNKRQIANRLIVNNCQLTFIIDKSIDKSLLLTK